MKRERAINISFQKDNQVLTQENTAMKSQIEQLKGLVQDREQLQKELRTAADYIIGLEEKLFSANKT